MLELLLAPLDLVLRDQRVAGHHLAPERPVDGLAQPMAAGTALFIPGDAEHGTVAGPNGFRMLYVFPRDRFSEVEYRFSPL